MSLSVHKNRVRSSWLLALCFAACLIVNLVPPLGCLAVGTSQDGWRTVAIASEGARPPYNYIDNNELAGLEIELARDLCARMKVSCSLIAQDWDGLI
ncbi:MAG: transporter substrate-binding domain-containing protein, partial [Methylocella sp.]